MHAGIRLPGVFNAVHHHRHGPKRGEHQQALHRPRGVQREKHTGNLPYQNLVGRILDVGFKLALQIRSLQRRVVPGAAPIYYDIRPDSHVC